MAAKSLHSRIVDAALTLADQRSWERVRLHDIAAELGIGLDGVRAHFSEKEEIVDAWFDRADSAMLLDAATPDFLKLDKRQRLHRAIMTWLSVLAPHRRVTRQMILGKLEPGHVHYQFAGLLRVSRTVQWLREAARADAPLPWRALEETALTGIYLLVFFHWMRDESEGSARTAKFLDRLLAKAEWFAHSPCLHPGAFRKPAEGQVNTGASTRG